MLRVQQKCPVDYRLCNQTVTVYHWDKQEGYTRQVIHNAFLDQKKVGNVDKTGEKEANSFLLVVPGDTQAVFLGDKVLSGIGPEIKSREDWAAFIPPKVPGLCVVQYVDCKFWKGQMVHTEAGG